MVSTELDFDDCFEKCKEGGEYRKIVEAQSTDEKLELYALGRQGKHGDNTEEKPGMFDLKGKYKWEAWNKKKGLDKDVAKGQFLELLKKFLAKKK